MFRPLFDALRFKQGNQRQLIAALVFAVFILLALILRTTSNTDANAAAIRLLIQALTVDAFDPNQAEHVAPGGLVVVMPAHNEAENVGAVIASIPKTVEGLPVTTLVIDDGMMRRDAPLPPGSFFGAVCVSSSDPPKDPVACSASCRAAGHVPSWPERSFRKPTARQVEAHLRQIRGARASWGSRSQAPR